MRLSAWNGELAWYEEYIECDDQGNQIGPVYQYRMIHNLQGYGMARNPHRYLMVNEYAQGKHPRPFISMPRNWFFGLGSYYHDYTTKP